MNLNAFDDASAGYCRLNVGDAPPKLLRTKICGGTDDDVVGRAAEHRPPPLVVWTSMLPPRPPTNWNRAVWTWTTSATGGSVAGTTLTTTDRLRGEREELGRHGQHRRIVLVSVEPPPCPAVPTA